MLRPGTGKQLKTHGRLLSSGIELGLSVVVGLLGGRWIDGQLGTEPWLMLLGLILGLIAGLRSLIKYAKQASAQETDEE